MEKLQDNRLICAGQFRGGEVEDGVFCGPDIEPGTFHGGEIEPGTFHGGEIEPGTFHHFDPEKICGLKDKVKDDKGNGEEDVSSDKTPVDTESEVKYGD